MTPEQRIQIIEWLMQREMLFARVHELEQSVNEIFGGEYPLSAPELPSRRKKKPRPKAKKKPAPKAWKPPVIRKFRDEENRYRIDFVFNDTPRVEFHTQAQLLKTFLAARLPGVEVLSLSVGKLQGDDWTETEVIYTLPDEQD